MAELALHPTVKPVEMIADAIKDCSKRGGIILDPFGGSGSTLIAAAKTGRRARLAELDPIYVDRDRPPLAELGQGRRGARGNRRSVRGRRRRPCRGRRHHDEALRGGRGDDAGQRTTGRSGAEAAPYEVGYGKPPKATRFKPGKSGNPRRPTQGLRKAPRPPTSSWRR